MGGIFKTFLPSWIPGLSPLESQAGPNLPPLARGPGPLRSQAPVSWAGPRSKKKKVALIELLGPQSSQCDTCKENGRVYRGISRRTMAETYKFSWQRQSDLSRPLSFSFFPAIFLSFFLLQREITCVSFAINRNRLACVSSFGQSGQQIGIWLRNLVFLPPLVLICDQKVT